MPQVDEFVDGSTLLQASTLGTRVTAQSMIVSGGVPGSFTHVFTVAQPVTSVIVNTGAIAARVLVAATTLTFAASMDTYVDLTIGGAYSLVVVNTGAGAPGLTPQSTRLYKAVTDSGGLTSITRLTGALPLGPGDVDAADETASNDTLTSTSTLTNTFHRVFYKMTQATAGQNQSAIPSDTTEAATLDTLSGGSLVSNLDRLRYVISTLYGVSWSSLLSQSKHVLFSDGSNAASNINLPQLTTINGQYIMNASGNLSNNFTLRGTLTVNNLVITGTFAIQAHF